MIDMPGRYSFPALCISLLKDLLAVRRTATCERYKIKNPDAEGFALLEEVCRGRGFLLKGGLPDTDRACSVVLDEFRAGKVGRITLERAPERPVAMPTPPKEAPRDGDD